MSIGSILVGIAFALVVGAYLARPFRTATIDWDRAIEAWVAEVRKSGGGVPWGPPQLRGAEEQKSEEVKEKVNYCSQCGRSVGSDDRFCAGCGTPLQEGIE